MLETIGKVRKFVDTAPPKKKRGKQRVQSPETQMVQTLPAEATVAEAKAAEGEAETASVNLSIGER
jgi:hypothetical protein